MKVALLLICLLSLTGCAALMRPATPEQKKARANTTVFVHIEGQVMILRYDENGDLIQ